MSKEPTWPWELDIGYPCGPDKRCGTCCNPEVTNAGAVIPGFQCSLIKWLAPRLGITNANPCVDSRWGTCKYHNVPLEAIKELALVLWPDGEAAGGASCAT